MDRYDAWYGQGRLAHRDQVLDLITDYRYFAPAMLAMDETYDRLLTEGARDRQAPARPVGTDSPMAAVRCQLGGVLIRLGTRLRGGPIDDHAATTAMVAA